ncbi:MAG: magnesium/cobalt transporter CorA [Nanoarchaeota archaeon]
MHKALMLENGEVKEGSIESLKKRNTVWLDFNEPSKQEISKISEIVGISENEINEMLMSESRPLLTNLEKYSVILMQTPVESEEHDTLPFLVFISKGKNDLITIHRHKMPSMEKIKAWDDKRKKKMFEKGSTFILYRIIDEITANYLHILTSVDDQIEKLEEGIYKENGSHKTMMQDAFEVKKKLIYFYKALTANREVVSAIEKEYGMFLEKKDLSKFRLLYSDFTQLIDLTVTYRDILTTTIEVYLSVVSNSLNVTVKKLTAWGAIILLPTLITGIYGMNFEHMPEIPWVHGYTFALGLMVFCVTAAYLYFKRKDWI